MPFPPSPANQERHTEAGRTWVWQASTGLWQPFLGYSVNAAGLPIGTIGNLTATNTQQALQQIFERTVEEGPQPEPTGTQPQGNAGTVLSVFSNPGLFQIINGGRFRRYAEPDTLLSENQTTIPMPPGWTSGMRGPALLADSTARMTGNDYNVNPGRPNPDNQNLWYNVAVQGIQTVWDSPGVSVTMPAQPSGMTWGMWALPRPGGQKRYADIWVWGYQHNIQFLWDPDTGSIPTNYENPNRRPYLDPGGTRQSPDGQTTIVAHDVLRMPSGWTFGWVQMTTQWAIEGFSICIADRVTNGTPGMQYWPGSPTTSGLYIWRWFVAPGLVSVPNLLG